VGKFISATAYVTSIMLGNILVVYLGLVNLFGLTFPAGAILIGITFSTRDFAQRYWGHKIWYFMILSAILTSLMSLILPNTLPVSASVVAVASIIAFIVSEAIDWLVYTLTHTKLEYRVIISNLFSIPLDSILFVGICFGTFDLFSPPVYGQAIVKYLSGLLIIPIILITRRLSKNVKH
jgi:queuosine precursor transporter